MAEHSYEQVLHCYDRPSSLRAIIAIHDTSLGPALGGVRMWPYRSEEEALHDVLRLARAMTYKAAAAGLNLGGGKAVILGDPKTQKSEILFRAFGRMVEGLHGRYIAAEDVGTNVWDMEYISRETRFVTGLFTTKGGSGDPSPMTAWGVYQGIRSCLRTLHASSAVEGRTVAIQGLGSVGYHLAKYLAENGARLVVADIHKEEVDRVVEEFGATPVEAEAIYEVECDVFSPCALGGVLNDETVPRLRCRIVAGSANNQLEDDRHGEMLHDRGIVYAPDFVINAGGLMNVYEELEGYNRERAFQKVSQLYDAIHQVLQMAQRKSQPTYRAANEVAEERIHLLREVRRTYIPRGSLKN